MGGCLVSTSDNVMLNVVFRRFMIPRLSVILIRRLRAEFYAAALISTSLDHVYLAFAAAKNQAKNDFSAKNGQK